MCQASDVLRRAAPGAAPSTGRGPTRRPFRSDAAERLILLGTAGASNPKATRAGYSNAIVVGDVAYLVDCGEGVHRQAWRSGVSMHPERRPKGGSTVRSIFFTHLHSDHVIDYINLMLGFWPTTRVDVFGPGEAGLPITPYPPDRVVPVLFPDAPTPGIRVLTQKLLEAFAYNERAVSDRRVEVIHGPDWVRIDCSGAAGYLCDRLCSGLRVRAWPRLLRFAEAWSPLHQNKRQQG